MIEKLIKQRKTIHRFKNEPIDESLINEAIALSRYAPNHHLTHPFRYYKMSDATKKAILTHAFDVFKERSQDTAERKIAKWQAIPGWLLISQKLSDNPKTVEEDYATISISLYIMMLYLEEKGIGSKWSTASLLTTPEIYQLMKIDPSKEKIVGMLWYGYPECTPSDHHYPDISEITFLR